MLTGVKEGSAQTVLDQLARPTSTAQNRIGDGGVSGGNELPNSESGSQLSDRPALLAARPRANISTSAQRRVPGKIRTPMENSFSARVVSNWLGWPSAMGPCLRRPLGRKSRLALALRPQAVRAQGLGRPRHFSFTCLLTS